MLYSARMSNPKTDDVPLLTPFQRLLLSAAGGADGRAPWVFALDNECAQVARVAREPMMAQIRLAWWRDGLLAETALPQHRSTVMDGLRGMAHFGPVRAHLVAMIDGWEELILHDGADDRAMLARYGAGRGGGLTGALFPERDEAGQAIGQLWALWDLAGHLSDDALAEAAMAQAREALALVVPGRRPRVLAMLLAAAGADVARGRRGRPDMHPRLYARLLRAQIFGR